MHKLLLLFTRKLFMSTKSTGKSTIRNFFSLFSLQSEENEGFRLNGEIKSSLTEHFSMENSIHLDLMCPKMQRERGRVRRKDSVRKNFIFTRFYPLRSMSNYIQWRYPLARNEVNDIYVISVHHFDYYAFLFYTVFPICFILFRCKKLLGVIKI